MALEAAERIARLQLARSERIGPVTFAQLIARYGSAQAALDALPGVIRKAGGAAYTAAPRDRIEAEIASLPAGERAEFLADLGLEEAGLDRVIRAGYRLLGLHSFFTAGPKECRAWTVRQGALAPQAAAVIHTDFERGFIRAEVIGYEDFIGCGGEARAREAGKLRVEGKEYIVADGDVMHFRFNV